MNRRLPEELTLVAKAIRVSQPFNAIATSIVRAALRALGRDSELVVRHLHRAGTVRCRLPNGRVLKLWSRGDDWVSSQLYWRGLAGYEPETVPVFLHLAARARVVFDIGAYVGFYTLLSAHANPSGRVFAFEPHPDAYARLVSNVRLGRLANVECLQMAAGAVDGEAEFFYVPGGLPTSSSLSQDFMRPHPGTASLTVRVARLDQIAADRGLAPVDLVKLDTESTEPDALEGMMDILRRDRPAIICEVLAGRGAEHRLEEMLGPLGYRYYLLTPDGPAARSRIVGHPQWLNYLFIERASDDVVVD